MFIEKTGYRIRQLRRSEIYPSQFIPLLRSWLNLGLRNYKHLAPTELLLLHSKDFSAHLAAAPARVICG